MINGDSNRNDTQLLICSMSERVLFQKKRFLIKMEYKDDDDGSSSSDDDDDTETESSLMMSN